ncbi:MAG: C26 family cysteine hydrolase domain-containing family [Acidimicrobiales bacterium]|nr:C26 family cysteine hydrolase domain-containing family [Acidimicrobiales bacterium]
MLVFVDYEHADGHDREHGPRVLAARTTITYRLEDLAGMPCHLVRYSHIDQALLDRLDTQAIFISGNSTDPAVYSDAELEPIRTIVRETDLPMFGLCGGFQLIAQALGADLVRLEADPAHATNDAVVAHDGATYEFGYHPVDLHPDPESHALHQGLGERPVFRHAHSLHIPHLPSGFEILASTAVTPVQMAAHTERKIAGTQFHPEYWTDEHPAGRILLANFLRWAGLPGRHN